MLLERAEDVDRRSEIEIGEIFLTTLAKLIDSQYNMIRQH